MDQPVVVTGASGFIAKHVVLRLLNAGYAVRGTLRNPARADEVRVAVAPHLAEPAALERLSFAQADLESDPGWPDAMAGAGALMHLASPFYVQPPRDPNLLVRPAVEGTRRVLAAARDAGVGRVVLTSSVAAIAGRAEKGRTRPYDEREWTDPADAGGVYNLSKTLAERAAWDFQRDEAPGMALTVINPGWTLGPPLDRHYGTSLDMVKTTLRRTYPLTANVGFGIADVRDVAEAHLRALDRPETAGERILVVGGSLWLPDWGKIIKAAIPGTRPTTGRAPNFVMRLMATFDSSAASSVPLLDRMPILSAEKLRRLLDITPRPAEEALLAAARWLVDMGEVRR